MTYSTCPVCYADYARPISQFGCSPVCQAAYPRIPRNSRLDRDRKTPRSIRPESLTGKHLGREFPNIGQLVEFRCSGDGWTLIGTLASETFPPDASIPYESGHHHG